MPGTWYSINVCIFFSHVLLFATPWTVAHKAPLSMGFSRQEYWSELSLPPPGDLPYPGIECSSFVSPALAGEFFTTEPLGKILAKRFTRIKLKAGAESCTTLHPSHCPVLSE